MDLPYTVFCDFDGTIAEQDVGNLLFKTYTDGCWRQFIELWRAGRISSQECLLRECGAATVSREELARFAQTQVVEKTFSGLRAFCQRRQVPLIVVSDGLDFYISIILKKYGHADLPVYTNVLTFQEKRLVPLFPYYSQGCGKCGNCKKYHVLRQKKNGGRIVYIGDGYSDRCAVQHADLVFAKKDLAQFCQQSGIPYVPFASFREITDYLEKK
jgi:2-hydroxy-3-keto-5-methylthiopentenyl-1-phosphate phosphatase